MKKKPSRSWFVFLCCLLGVPTCTYMLPGAFACDRPETALGAGMLLGIAHVLLRPVLRLLSAPIGCLTFGLFGLVIDVGLIYACAHYIPGFAVLDPLYALLTALFINIMCFIVSGRK